MNYSRQREELVAYLKEMGYIRSKEVEEAFLAVPREEFVPRSLRDSAYVDSPLPIGYGQTISAPHMVAIMTEALQVEPGHRVLEVGTGSGYQAAILAHIVSEKPGGHVYTIEIVPQLARRGYLNICRALPDICTNVTVYLGDGTLGLPEFAPYDRIVVTAGAKIIPPPLLEQLAPGGVMVIPVGSRYEQELLIVKKLSDGTVKIERSIPCIFVPLVGKYGWQISEWFL